MFWAVGLLLADLKWPELERNKISIDVYEDKASSVVLGVYAATI